MLSIYIDDMKQVQCMLQAAIENQSPHSDPSMEQFNMT
jgi:hypothetical protein